MRIMLKRWAGLCLLTILISLVFSACGSGDNTATTVPAAQSPAAQTTAAASSNPTTAAASSNPATTAAANGQLIDLNILLISASSESGPPPADWPVYQTIKDKLGINLKLS